MGYCRDCIYFKRDAGLDDYGMKHNECHRYPKSAKSNSYPDVSPFDWCGEYRSKAKYDINGFVIKTVTNDPPKEPKKQTKFVVDYLDD